VFRTTVIWLLSSIFLLYFVGCSRWHYLSRWEISGAQGKSKAVITLNNSRTLTVFHPRVSDSSLTGELANGDEGTFLLSEIRQIAVREFDPMRTVLMGTAIVSSAIIIVALTGDSSPKGDTCPPTDGG